MLLLKLSSAAQQNIDVYLMHEDLQNPSPKRHSAQVVHPAWHSDTNGCGPHGSGAGRGPAAHLRRRSGRRQVVATSHNSFLTRAERLGRSVHPPPQLGLRDLGVQNRTAAATWHLQPISAPIESSYDRRRIARLPCVCKRWQALLAGPSTAWRSVQLASPLKENAAAGQRDAATECAARVAWFYAHGNCIEARIS